ncbi:hypothetical protein NEOLI_001918 [Neolecta irregularis DAH-3]|uniref:C3H1-type domain-containing protein n=1 Tax=Neolecta irregularis (strain DAH-3) TaxID=1198029 RepID=A0A1U7LV45_NEOID|nr:hypothetical protein NEOLI_001918 [Neolecta irregularis DAH-3]|eukprot:OLL26514.1 hypothetical protein NEOLI_001918 [Neolecta irregularis DAH-3]
MSSFPKNYIFAPPPSPPPRVAPIPNLPGTNNHGRNRDRNKQAREPFSSQYQQFPYPQPSINPYMNRSLPSQVQNGPVRSKQTPLKVTKVGYGISPTANSAAEERPVSTVRIQGTKISLDSPQEIALWIAERKKNWPTAANIARKEEERQRQIPAKKRKLEKVAQSNNAESETERPIKACLRFQKGRCRFGKRCRYKHDNIEQANVSTDSSHQWRNRKSLYSRLVETEVERENVIILQVIKEMVARGLAKDI